MASTGADAFSYTLSDGHGGADSATVIVTVTASPRCELYPIALHLDTLAGVEVGQEMEDIYNGSGPGNFGWLSWRGDQGVPALVNSLTPPGDSESYVNPNDPQDHHLSVGDWAWGRPGVGNAQAVRDALDALMPLTITLPVWDEADGQGANLRYHVVGFAQVQVSDYHLPGQNRISAIFRGMTNCSSSEWVNVSITGLESDSPVELGAAMSFTATVVGDLPIPTPGTLAVRALRAAQKSIPPSPTPTPPPATTPSPWRWPMYVPRPTASPSRSRSMR